MLSPSIAGEVMPGLTSTEVPAAAVATSSFGSDMVDVDWNEQR